MRLSERGIGNLAFIAVLVLLVIAAALFFMKQSELDDTKQKLAQARSKAATDIVTIDSAGKSYDALKETLGSNIAALDRKGENYPTPKDIRDSVRDWLFKTTEEIRAGSKATVRNRVWTINSDTKEVGVQPGDPTEITLYNTSFVKETMTVRNVLDPLATQFKWAAKAISENNSGFESADAEAKTRVAAIDAQMKKNKSKYDSDVSAKGQQADGFKQEADTMRDQNNSLISTNDALNGRVSTIKDDADKKVRAANQDKNAWKNRAIAEKEKKKIALAEDPKDGEVLVADMRAGLVFINLGSKNRVSAGTNFKVWRFAKGNLRENVAHVRVFKVDKTRSTCRIIKLLNPRVPVTAGMNVSNPFFDPTKKLKAFVWGDLKTYPTDIAKRRLAASGVIVASKLDDTVNVIVLGEPPVTAIEAEDEAEAALAERRMSVERDKNLRYIHDLAVEIGAIVVTEDVLSTFVDY